MKFDPLTKDLFTDQGVFIKTMNCPYKMTWDNLIPIDSTVRKCAICDHSILETKDFTDEELLKIVRQNPTTCLKIDLHQHNIKMASNGNLEQK